MWELGLGIILIALILVLYTFVVRHKITISTKSAVELELKKDRDRLDALSKLIGMTHLSEQELVDYSLDEAVRLTESTVGYLHFVHEDQVNLELFCWSRSVHSHCTAEKISKYPIESAGIWADCVRRENPVIHNDYKLLSFSDRLPKGHIPIQRHMSVPIYDGEIIVAVVGVGNKEKPYTDEDTRQLTLFMTNMWSILKAKRYETEVKRERDKAEKYLDMVEVIVLVLDENAHVKMLNRKCCDVLGYTEEELLGKNWMECCIPKENRAEIHSIFNDIVERGGVNGLEYVEGPVKRRDGEFRTIRWHNSVLRSDSTGEVIGTLSAGEDVTELREFERQQKIFMERASQTQKLESIGTLAGGIAHDFNNILAPMLGYAELLHMDMLSESEEQEKLYYTESILKAGGRAKELVNQILTFSRKDEDYRSIVDIIPIVKESIKLLRSTIPVSINIDSDIQIKNAPVLCNPVKIQQIVMNLGVNAYQATGEHGNISFKVSKKIFEKPDVNGLMGMEPGAYVCLSLMDNGIGITDENLSKIFDPFFTTKKNKEGTGLGLSIVHGIVTSCKGEIRVYSEVGIGTTFNVYLPVVEGASEEFSRNVEEAIVGGDEKVLLVDDEHAVGDVMEKMLKGLGYDVSKFRSSEEALNSFVKNPEIYKLIITDQSMPDITGVELSKKILEISPYMNIILCTGYKDKDLQEKAWRVGVRAVLPKPFTLREFAAVIRKVLDEDIRHSNKSITS